jgi:feruloyl esterase
LPSVGSHNGGFAGSISWGGLAAAVSRGYAASSTDTGHQAGGTDASWALGHPEKVMDYGYRAIHETAVTAKALIRAFYGEGPKRSYFNSCSNGGRQALMEAQRFPDDYDGIIAGAPANHWTHLLSSAAWDGVLNDPSQCRFDPHTLLCQGAENDTCLTAPQAAALLKLYQGPRDARGRQVFPGYSPGGEAEAGGWGAWITGPAPQQAAMFLFATQFFKNMVFEDPNWDFRAFDLERDTKVAVRKTAHILNSNNPDLKKFHARGGKLIVYHGWCDAAIPPQNAINYFRSVEKKMGAKNTASFLRLFLAPGVQHCAGGSGPDSFGQSNGVEGDALHDLDAALERWVEQSIAPEKLIATKYKSGAAVRTRPLCPFPQMARWSGSGSTGDASNFTCAAPR